MIVGDAQTFALESEILFPVDSVAQQAVGFFVVHISGNQFGVREEDATCLGCSANEVAERLLMRGSHVSEQLFSLAAADIADVYLANFYGEAGDSSSFEDAIRENNLIWCPDGDAAFDDGSHILQFDHEDYVRLIAFRNSDEGTADLVERTMFAAEYYSILKMWLTEFRRDRDVALKNTRR
ncbi:Imm42 family immunity protein [Pararhizobium gei]|uniref:Imm42 family immunity protein n=1 Tax=Pararhizobium gei TaxID=1395951 RepID=UPI0023DBC538|nr:Imm42 family immunity protein [Rhizobium gei]